MRSSTMLFVLGALVAALPWTTEGATLTVADLAPGDLVITEYLANPVGVADTAGEYFEVFNRRNAVVNLDGLVVRDDGSNQFTVAALTLNPGDFAVFSNGDGSELGILVDYVYGTTMSLTNSDDEIVLVGTGNQELFRLGYSDGDAFGAGVASELVRLSTGLTAATDSDYQAASQGLLLGNLGSPGTAGGTSIPTVPLPAAAWLLASALGCLGGLRRSSSTPKTAPAILPASV